MLAEVDFETFFRSEHPKLVGVALGMTGNREAAVDLAQEALLRCHRDWATVATLDNPGAWVRRVLINLAIDHHRRRERERSAIERSARSDIVSFVDPSIDHWWSSVHSLPDRQRAVVVLHYLGDVSVADVGRALGIAEGTVKATLAKARRSLARTLGVALEELT